MATLVCERDNPHDDLAVRVDISGRTVGHLSRDDARRYRTWLIGLGRTGEGVRCRAEIRGGWDRGPEDRGHFGVVLDLPPLPRASRVSRAALRPRTAPPERDPFDFGDQTPRRPARRSARNKPIGNWFTLLMVIVAAPVMMCCCCGFIGNDHRGAVPPDRVDAGRIRYSPALAAVVRIDQVRRVKWTNPDGRELLMLCVDWTNTGNRTIRAIKADIAVTDRDGGRHESSIGNWGIFFSTTGVRPGESYTERPEDAYVLGPMSLVGDEIRVVNVNVTAAAETVD